MRKATVLFLTMAVLIGSGLAAAQEKGAGQAPAQPPAMGPGMMGQGMPS